jgi:predicted adenylyl cyclase CyaB
VSLLNVEIKARCQDLNSIRRRLHDQKITLEKNVRQVDTYFHCTTGKLKLRETPEKCELIHYQREQIQGPKKSTVTFYYPDDPVALKNILTFANKILVVVEKQREIYWSGNVKIHLDQVQGLGTFLEIEAIDFAGQFGIEQLYPQCQYFLDLFQVKAAELITGSYSDLLLAQNPTPS